MILETEVRVGYENFYYVIVPDHAAGRRHRFTAYKIPSSPATHVKVIGRELTLAHARRVCREDQDQA